MSWLLPAMRWSTRRTVLSSRITAPGNCFDASDSSEAVAAASDRILWMLGLLRRLRAWWSAPCTSAQGLSGLGTQLLHICVIRHSGH